MYISRVKIDKHDRRKIKDLKHVGAYHNWVEESFPQELAEGVRSRKLWRIDRLKDSEFLLIVSEDKPNLEKLERYGVKGTAESQNYDKFLDCLEDGMRAEFRVVLNPVISKMDKEHGDRGRVMPHITVEHQMNFIEERSLKNGFSLSREEYAITNREFVLLRNGSQRSIRLSKVTYEGQLIIKDVGKFRQLLTNGFGKKKAYGFGLMSVIPVSK